jgi:hypothetical protein
VGLSSPSVDGNSQSQGLVPRWRVARRQKIDDEDLLTGAPAGFPRRNQVSRPRARSGRVSSQFPKDRCVMPLRRYAGGCWR